jgi:multidrug efflux system membrane fusion protein
VKVLLIMRTFSVSLASRGAPFSSRVLRRGWVLLLFAFTFPVVGCSNKQAAAPPPPPVPVRVARVTLKTVPVELRAIGTVEALSTVSIKSKVAGELTAVHFREGQDVRKGDLLFEIDRQPFEVALRQAEAALARDQARLANARAQAARYAKLFEEGVASREQADQTRTDLESLDATVRADQAAVEKAKLDLSYCSIASPVDGRTGSLLVNEGNLVKASDDPPLVILNQLTPIYVSFAVPEQYLAEIKRFLAAGRLPISVNITEDQPSESGQLTFVDNAVDSATGTIRLKGTFANPARHLWPGQFVNVVLRLSEQANAVVVPSEALQTGQSGQFVYVVNDENVVESRPVFTGRSVQGVTVVEKGLAPGELVVTDGQLRLVPGAKIQIKEAL